MARTYDISDKLKFEEKPKIVIKGIEIEINNDAVTILEVMNLIGNSPTPDSILKMCRLIFSEKDQKKIEKLHLSFNDYTTVIMTAVQIASGGTEGETVTPVTT